MPVMDQLFEARKTYSWDHAREIAANLTDEEDLIGDLADELGDEANALRRAQSFLKMHSTHSPQVNEPKAAVFLMKQGVTPQLSWEARFSQPFSPGRLKPLLGKTWLLHESVWMSRHLNQSEKVQEALVLWRSQGLQVKRPFAQGRDCIDCGGEGAYSKLFPDQAQQMAVEFWERDAHRADGILCISDRCATHFKKSLGTTVPIVSLQNLLSN
jgi:hypothetical protein